jgi:hypothetical protein
MAMPRGPIRPPIVNAASAQAELVCFSTFGELRRGTIEKIPPELASSFCASAACRQRSQREGKGEISARIHMIEFNHLFFSP